MQSYTPLGDTATTTVKEAVLNHENNINAIRSTNSGTAFPTDNLEEGMHCYRTDLSKDYIYTGGEWKEFLGDYAKSDDIANEVSTKSLTVTGETSVPTPDTANNSTTIANTSFVHGVVNELVNGAPTALDTLQELATALGNDPNFSTTVLDKIGEKESKTDANVEYAAIRSEAASTYATKTEVDTKQDKGNYVGYTSNANITYGDKTGTTYTYSQSPMVVSNGIVIGGTAQNAGLVTRGICGVTTPATTGACSKDELYLNYDGDNKYERATVLGANNGGDAITTSTNSSTTPTYTYGKTYSAIRGDQMVNYVNAKVGTLSTVAHSGDYTDLTNKPSIPSKTSELTNDSNYVVSTALSKVATSGSYSDLTNKPTVDSTLSSTSTNAIQNKAVNTALSTYMPKTEIESTYLSKVDAHQLQRSTKYAVGDIAYDPSLPSYLYLECTTAGTTGTTEPDLSTVTGGVTVSDGTAVFALKDLRNRHNVGDIVIKDTTPKDYEYLLPCDGQTFDKTVYVLLAELYPDGVLPNLNDNRFLEGAKEAGVAKDAGLPNITGAFEHAAIPGQNIATNGAMYQGRYIRAIDGGLCGGGLWNDLGVGIAAFGFNASQSNSIYGASDTVQPKSYTVRYYVCYA